MKKKLFYSFLSILFISLFIGLIINTINAFEYSNVVDQIYDINDDSFAHGKFYSSSYKNFDEAKNNSKKISEEIIQEGTVLLKNNNVLPLKKDSKITLFSRSSVDLVYSGTGSSNINFDDKITLKDAFEDKGIKVNNILWNRYLIDSNYRKAGIMEDKNSKYQMSVGESDKNIYLEQKIINSFYDFNDLAIIVISRIGGEGYDLSKDNFIDGQNGYLSLTTKEQDMIDVAKAYFKKTLVLINSCNPLELSFIEEKNIDACLWIGYVGEYGLNGLISLILGEVSPSGRLVDTYVSNNKFFPSSNNIGDYNYLNYSSSGEWDTRYNYLIEQEGIYIGYKYFETRYEDTILNKGSARDNFNYYNQVIYPFGYGLSYTNFKQEIIDVKKDNDEINLDVKVTNIGKYESKDVVQLYYQSEYTLFDQINNIEKSSVNLIGFEKTKSLKPNEEQIISLKINLSSLVSYDYKINKTYLLEKGNYYLSLGNNAHEAINNILAKKGYQKENIYMLENGNKNKCYNFVIEENIIFDQGKNIKITNQLNDVNINYYLDNKINYLSRNDYKNTYPKELNNLSGENIIPYLENDYSYVKKEANDILLNQEQEYKILDMKEVNYNDEKWDKIVSQMSKEEIALLVFKGGFATNYIESVGNPLTYDRDGTVGIAGNNVNASSGTLFPSQVNMASTFNKDLIYEVGKAIAEEALYLKVIGWYAPGLNIHRSPYGGRNYEYFSEDSYLSGVMGAYEVNGAQNKGLIVNAKHFILNDLEIHRNGVCVFNNEQALREIYLKPFEYVVKNSSILGIMLSLNRVGTIYSGAHYGLINNILREEWGFVGRVITDFTNEGKAYMSIKSCLQAGTDMWLCSTDFFVKNYLNEIKNDDYLIELGKKASKNILYSQSKSSAINLEARRVTKSWKISIIFIDVLTFMLFSASLFMLIKEFNK